jgi:hypothetical protein
MLETTIKRYQNRSIETAQVLTELTVMLVSLHLLILLKLPLAVE